jgi:hypothetical protein
VGASVSSFGTAELLGRDLTSLGRKLVPPVNPQIEYVDLKHHVYTKIIVGPESMDVRYMAVSAVSQPASQVFLLQRFIIPDGESRLVLQQSSGERRQVPIAPYTIFARCHPKQRPRHPLWGRSRVGERA